MSIGFESEELTEEKDSKDDVQLTEREKAIAGGRDPEDAQEDSEESEDTQEEADGKDADTQEVVASEGKEASASDWVSDEVKALAESYGIDEESLSTSFESESEFRRFASMLERYSQPSEEKSESKEEPSEEESKAESRKEQQDDVLDPEVFKEEGYDDNTVKIVDALAKSQGHVKELQGRLQELEQRLSEGDKQRETDTLHQSIDELGGRFGQSEALTKDQRQDREKLLESVDLVKQDLDRRGEEGVSTSVILRRAELLAFGDEILEEEKAKEKDALAKKVKKQSAKRRPVGRSTKQTQPKQDPSLSEDPVKAIANAPDLVEFWNNLEE